MLGGKFSEELKKNKVLSNKSNKFAKLYFQKFDGKKQLTLYGSTYLNYGYLMVETTNATTLKIYYKDILLACIVGSKQVLIPIAIENNSSMVLDGVVDELKISLFGAKFYNERCNYVIPLKNYKVVNAGRSFVKSYSNKDAFANNSFVNVFDFKKLYSSQVCNVSNYICHGNLIEDGGVYLLLDTDNYTTKTKVEEGVKSATIVPTDMEKIIVAYIKNGKLFFKTVTSNFDVSNEIEIDKKLNLVPIAFCPIEVYDFYANIFAVVWNNGSISIFEFDKDNFVNKFTFKGDKVKIQLFEDGFKIVKLNDYGVSVNKYTLSSSGVTLIGSDDGEYKINVNDYYLIEGCSLYFNNENCTEC